jgi:hypothetical protein
LANLRGEALVTKRFVRRDREDPVILPEPACAFALSSGSGLGQVERIKESYL